MPTPVTRHIMPAPVPRWEHRNRRKLMKDWKMFYQFIQKTLWGKHPYSVAILIFCSGTGTSWAGSSCWTSPSGTSSCWRTSSSYKKKTSFDTNKCLWNKCKNVSIIIKWLVLQNSSINQIYSHTNNQWRLSQNISINSYNIDYDSF